MFYSTQAKEYIDTNAKVTKERKVFEANLQQFYKKVKSKKGAKPAGAKKQKVVSHKAMGEMPDAEIAQQEAQQLCPEFSTIYKDSYNGRWRIVFTGYLRHLPSVSRSWTSLGTGGEKKSLRSCLKVAWAHAATVTGAACPHPELAD